MSFILYLNLYTPLPAWSNMLYIGHGLQSTLKAIQTFQRSIEALAIDSSKPSSNDKKAKISSPTNFIEVLAVGQNVCKFFHTINSSFGALIFEECAITLFVMITGAYTGLSNLIVLAGQEEISGFILCFFLQGTMVFTLSGYRLLFTVNFGEDIQVEIAKTKNMLRQQMLAYHDELDEKTRFRCAMIQEKLDRFQCLKPKKIFCLNKAMMLGAASTLATYLVIMMQFKTGELNGQPTQISACGNATTFVMNATNHIE